jgi:K+/H+ antiporter YhaU regulatory subunit KhtT
MGIKHQPTAPVYQKIAIDVAQDIVNGYYKKGDLLTGRSSLAAKYSVSPETIRRAMFILKDLQIVTILSGVGIVIEDPGKAALYLKRIQNVETFAGLGTELRQLAEQQQKLNQLIETKASYLLNKLEHYRVKAPIAPYELKITSNCRFLGQMISQINFWQNTGVTVVAIRRQEELLISPGPYATFEAGDIFVLVGPEGSEKTVFDFIYPEAAPG